MRKVLFVILGIGVFCFCFNLYSDSVTLHPCEDVYLRVFGGGEGRSTFMKFNIGGVTADTIDSVFLEVYVWQRDSSASGYWDGDVIFWNVNSQTWNETTHPETLWNIPTSDSTLQTSGFGDKLGWTRSIDLKNIFIRDFSASNTFCSIKMKDPDDITSVPSETIDSDDTLMLGSGLNIDHLYFYPHEHDSTPRLIVHYTLIKAEERSWKYDYKVKVLPNVIFNKQFVTISYQLPSDSDVWLGIYDNTGRVIKDLATKNQLPGDHKISIDISRLKRGIYFVGFRTKEYRTVRKIIVLN
jgi:hypothetical protein